MFGNMGSSGDTFLLAAISAPAGLVGVVCACQLMPLVFCCLQAKVHPEQPGYSVDREAFERIWYHSVDLLQRGFQTGSILTVDPEDAQKLGKPWTRR